MGERRPSVELIAPPPARLSIGITGHRPGNAAFAANAAAVEASLVKLFDALDSATIAGSGATRLHSLLAPGVDMMAIGLGLSRGWEVVVPLPFGLDLNVAVNCQPASEADTRGVIEGKAPDAPAVAVLAAQIRQLADRVQLFELADQDALVTQLLLAAIAAPDDIDKKNAYSIHASERAAVAARTMIEQSDLLVAVWDGVSPGAVGGTRHSIASALYHGVPVIWVDASNPEMLRLLSGPDDLDQPEPERELAGVMAAIGPIIGTIANERDAAEIQLEAEKWHAHSRRRYHAYRRIEALFGSGPLRGRFRRLVEHYERPDEIALGSGAGLMNAACGLPGTDAAFVDRFEAAVLGRFAWADGLSTYLSDAYRGGMVTNFLLSALAITIGVAYLPILDPSWKWPFALGELTLLLAIVFITQVGRRKRWHGRWLETRRVAEYLRHAPILLLLGIARPTGSWPRGADSHWPEQYSRQVLRDLGLPKLIVTQAYLRAALSTLLARHVSAQRDYHQLKAARLARVHHRLDLLSEILFILAIASVSAYLLLTAADALGFVSTAFVDKFSKWFTFLGVSLPALGGAFAGIRYLGDFERFAAISRVTAEKLSALQRRITEIAEAGGELRYEQVASLARAVDETVVAEIESWQSVFAMKNMTVPV